MEITLFDNQGSDRHIRLSELSCSNLTNQQLLWVDLDRERDSETSELTAWLGIASLGLPSKAETGIRPRVDHFGSWIKLRVGTIGSDSQELPLYFLVGRNWIVTVHDGPNEVLESFKRQIRADSQLGQLTGAGVLAAMLDWHLTGIFRTIESFERQVDAWDDKAMAPAHASPILPQLRQLRQKIARLRRLLVPHREVYAALLRPDIASVFGTLESPAVFGTLWNQLERAVDSIDNARELVLGSFEMYTAQVAQRTNDTMRLLTVVTVLLLPIGTLAGILGMNFQARFFATQDRGFWTAVSVMILLVVGGASITYRRGWIRL